ncbi:MAG TPA: hypothetical protein VFK32_04845, partial [Tepidiformaceae bacterium]|nr:hypothetical protein [Tepidiformaceae bacterium]
EAQGRIIVSALPGSTSRLADLAAEHNVPATRIGSTIPAGGFTLGPISAPLADLQAAYNSFA